MQPFFVGGSEKNFSPCFSRPRGAPTGFGTDRAASPIPPKFSPVDKPAGRVYTERECFGKVVNPMLLSLPAIAPAVSTPPPAAVMLYLDDFAGGRCRAVVTAGQSVRLGDPVGVSAGGAWVHASVSGTVRAVSAGALVVENDFRFSPGRAIEPLSSLDDVPRAAVLRRLGRSGLLTADDAPLPEQLQPCHALALAVLTEADAAVFFAMLHQVLGGFRAMGRLVQPRRLLLFHDRRMRAVERAARRLQLPAETVAVDGTNPQLDLRLAGRGLEPGVTLGDLGCLVFSPRGAAALFAAIYLGQPYIQQAVVICGPGRRERTVRTVPLGTSAAHLLTAAHRTAPTILLGDAATGQILRNPNIALGKGDGLLTCLTGNKLTPADPG